MGGICPLSAAPRLRGDQALDFGALHRSAGGWENVPLVSPSRFSGTPHHHKALILFHIAHNRDRYSPVLEFELALVAGHHDVGGLDAVLAGGGPRGGPRCD
jgi:hypothetical protein